VERTLSAMRAACLAAATLAAAALACGCGASTAARPPANRFSSCSWAP